MADPEFFISGGPLIDLRGGRSSHVSVIPYISNQFFSQKGGPGPPAPPKSASDFPKKCLLRKYKLIWYLIDKSKSQISRATLFGKKIGYLYRESLKRDWNGPLLGQSVGPTYENFWIRHWGIG